MKKTRVYIETLKELVRKDPKKFKRILAVILGFILTLILITPAYPHVPDDVTMSECKQALTNYIEDPISYPIDTQKYSLHISNAATRLEIRNSDAYCSATKQEDGTYNYVNYYGSIETFMFSVWSTFVFTALFYFIIYGIIALFCWLFPIVNKGVSHIIQEYNIIKSKAEFNISENEAREHPHTMQLKEEYDRAYKKGYNAGFVKGRKEGFVEGQEDAYSFGWTNGYNKAQQNDDEYKTFEEIEAYLNDENTPS